MEGIRSALQHYPLSQLTTGGFASHPSPCIGRQYRLLRQGFSRRTMKYGAGNGAADNQTWLPTDHFGQPVADQ
jgi:hypothetical protein